MTAVTKSGTAVLSLRVAGTLRVPIAFCLLVRI